MSKHKPRTTLNMPTYKDPFEDPSSIGNVLIKMGKVSRDQLSQALNQRDAHGTPLLGVLLQKLGLVNEADVAKALKVQLDMREGDPLTAELDVLETQMEAAACGAQELKDRIHSVKQSRRDRGEKSDVFILPTVPVTRV